jgi:hypothetical protein
MSDFAGASSGLPSRRAVVGAAIWSVPVIAVVTATPAFAASTVPPGAIDLSPISLWNQHTHGNPGPIGINVQFGYRASSIHDPAVALFTWSLTVSGPTGSHTVESGSGNIARYGTWQKNGIMYPENLGSLPAGTYTFTFTVKVTGISPKSTTAKITI